MSYAPQNFITPLYDARMLYLKDKERVFSIRGAGPDVGRERHPVMKRVMQVTTTVQQVAMGSLVSGVMFGALSTFMGMFAASAMANDPTQQATMKTALADLGQTLKRRARSGFRSGAMIGAAFAFSDPIVEQVRHSSILTFACTLFVGLSAFLTPLPALASLYLHSPA
jgi:hypothetical protein